MAYKQPRVPPLRDGMQPAAYLGELILFLKDFSLETWAAVRALQGADKDQLSQIVTRGQIEKMLSEQAQRFELALEQSGEEARKAADAAVTSAIDSALPVGIVISMAQDTDPNTLYPWQVWTRIADGRMQSAANDAHPLGETGGEETHQLTLLEMPVHNHAISDGFWNYQQNGEGYPGSVYKATAAPHAPASWDVTKYAGGGEAHNNMPPYIARNVWQRTQ